MRSLVFRSITWINSSLSSWINSAILSPFKMKSNSILTELLIISIMASRAGLALVWLNIKQAKSRHNSCFIRVNISKSSIIPIIWRGTNLIGDHFLNDFDQLMSERSAELVLEPIENEVEWEEEYAVNTRRSGHFKTEIGARPLLDPVALVRNGIDAFHDFKQLFSSNNHHITFTISNKLRFRLVYFILFLVGRSKLV